MKEWYGKAVIVTGGASGIGHGVGEAFAEAGADVHVVDRVSPEASTRLPAIHYHAMNVTDEGAWERLFQGIGDGPATLRTLVNNAGIGGPFGPIDSVSKEAFEGVMAVNLTGAFLGMKHFIRHMRKKEDVGTVVNIASVGGCRARSFFSPYAASKAALIQLSRSVAVECSQQKLDVRVNTLCPGAVDTPLLHRLIEAMPGGPVQARRQIAEGIPVGRIATTEEIASAVLFLAGEASRYVQGTELVVDGGAIA